MYHSRNALREIFTREEINKTVSKPGLILERNANPKFYLQGRSCDGYQRQHPQYLTTRVAYNNRLPTHDRTIYAEGPIKGISRDDENTKVINATIDFSTQQLSRPLSPTPVEEVHELRYLEFFRLCSLPSLWSAPAMDWEWSRMILQASIAERSLRHAVLAFASLHEKFFKAGPLVQIVEPDGFVLQNYNRAIGELSTNLKAPDQSTNLTLMVCLMFIGNELLQGNNSSAFVHLDCGLKIIRSKTTREKPRFPGVITIEQIFLRLHTHAVSFLEIGNFSGSPSFQLCDPVSEDLRDFKKLREAGEGLHIIMSRMYNFLQQYAYLKTSPTPLPAPPAATVDRDDQEDLLHQWFAAFTALLKRENGNLKAGELFYSIQLHVLARTVSVMLATSLDYEETTYDRFESVFSDLLTPISSLVVAETKIGKRLNFSAQVPIDQPLYMIATKCRQPSIRREAVALLKQVKTRHGLWDALVMAKVAQRLVDIEEEGMTHVQSSVDILESKRAHCVSLIVERRQQRFQIRYRRCEEHDYDWVWEEESHSW
ncbi:hypothetical protein MMC18_006495 [Xylographa bjoerkii]|nr:hypothetical protein [Xylographa bjoerkii]